MAKPKKTHTRNGVTIDIIKFELSNNPDEKPSKIYFRKNGSTLRSSEWRTNTITYEEYFIANGDKWYLNEFMEVK